MGWNTACVFLSKREEGVFGKFPPHLADRAQQVITGLNWEVDGQPKASELDTGLAPPSGWFCVGAYDGAAALASHPDLYGLVEALDRPFVPRCLSLIPNAQVLFWELSESTGYVAYALYHGDNLQRAFVCDPDRGVVLNRGDLQPEEETVLGKSSSIDWHEVADPLLFAMTGRFLGSPLNKFAAENLPAELFKQRRSWWSKIGLVVFLFAALSVAVHAQTRSEDRLAGPVQTVMTEIVELATKDGKSGAGPRIPVQAIDYDARGNRVKKVDFNRDGSVAQTIVYNYDAEGRSTGYEDYASGLSTPRKHVYVLDQDGNRAEYKIIQPNGSAGDETYRYKYDAKKYRIAEALYHKNALISRNENTYDDQGRLISQVMYNPDGSVSSTIRNSFGPDGKPVERVRQDGDLLTYRIRYKYDSKGRLEEVETVGSYVEMDSGSEGYVTGKVVYVYKGKDRPKETMIYNPDGSFRERVIHEYDSRGNWTRRTRRVKPTPNDKETPVQIEYRTITYQ